jgi:hypothetical protein
VWRTSEQVGKADDEDFVGLDAGSVLQGEDEEYVLKSKSSFMKSSVYEFAISGESPRL